jgi:hypothetical protein
MDKATIVKTDIQFVISQNFGKAVSESFKDAYGDSTLPIFLDNAQNVLEELIGKKKATETIQTILTHHNIKGGSRE